MMAQEEKPSTLGIAGSYLVEAIALLATVTGFAVDCGLLFVRLCVGKAGLADIQARLLALYSLCETLIGDVPAGKPKAEAAGCVERVPSSPLTVEVPAPALKPAAIASATAPVTPVGQEQRRPAVAAAAALAAAPPAAPAADNVAAAAPAGGLAEGGRLRSFQLQDEDLFGVSLSENGIPPPSGSDAGLAADDGSQLLDDFPAAPATAMPDQRATAVAPAGSHQLAALVLPAPPSAGTAPSSDYGTPHSQQGSDTASFFSISEYNDLQSPRSDGGANSKWVAAHPLSALNKAVSECSEEEQQSVDESMGVSGGGEHSTNGDVGDDASDVGSTRKKRSLRKVLLRRDTGRSDSGKNGKQRGLLKRLFGKKAKN